MKNKLVDGFNHFTGRKGFDYSEILDGVIIGTNMCCQFGFAKELLTKNVRADISLDGAKIDAPRGVDYFLWLPTADGRAPMPDKLSFGVQALDFLVSHKIKVFIHCQNGHGRAPTLFIAYLMKKGMTLDAAFAFLKEKRPSVHLTEAQMVALSAFGTSLNGEGGNDFLAAGVRLPIETSQ
jgi:hypothetical protein